MLVGEAPGAEEENTRTPFVGAAGKEIDACLASVGLSRNDVFITNSVRCRPPGNRTPLISEMNACFPYLAEEIDAIQPKIILCLGGAALKSLTGKEGVASNRGAPVTPKKGVRTGDSRIFVTYHPAAILHARQTSERERIRDSIIQDLQLVRRLADGGEQSHKTPDHRRAVLQPGYTLDTLKRCIDHLSTARVAACDLEWLVRRVNKDTDRMLWPWSQGADMLSIALTAKFGDKYDSVAFSWPLPEGGKELLDEFFAKVPVVFHNAMADMIWLGAKGFKVRLAGDSMFLAYLIDEEQSLKLGHLAPLYAGIDPSWKLDHFWYTRPYSTDGWNMLLEYNSDDTYATLKLIEALTAHIKKLSSREQNGIYRVYQHVLLASVPTMVNCALRGTPMDHEAVWSEFCASKERENELRRQMAAIINGTPKQAGDMAGSTQKTVEFLRSYGLEIESSNQDALVGYDNYPIVPLIQQYRWETAKVQSTYFGSWDTLLKEQGDGRLHNIYRLTSARTGRTSAELEIGAGLQVAPREKYVRRTVKARDGYKIMAPDFSQVELRVAAWFAEEDTMLRFFHEDRDLHAMTAAYVKANKERAIRIQDFLPNADEFVAMVSKNERQSAKGVNFGLIFGLQPQGLIEYAKKSYGVDFTLAEATQAHRSYFELYPKLVTWHNYCRTVIFNRGWTETPFGRFRHHIEDPNKAINTPVQATASDIALFAMYHIDRELERLGWPCHIIGFIHDSILFECRDDYLKLAGPMIKHNMEHPDLSILGVDSIPVPLKADITIGQTWADCVDWDDYWKGQVA